VRVWTYVGINSFGGPAGQIAVMHRVLVEEKQWISEKRFLHALQFCMLLPGPEAQQLSVYIGWLLHRTLGGILAGVLFVLPGAIAMLLCSMLYVTFRETSLIEGILFGIKPAVLAIVLEATVRIGRRALTSRTPWYIAGGAFAAIFFLGMPFPLVVVLAGVLGLGLGNHLVRPHDEDDHHITADLPTKRDRGLARALTILAIGLTLWLGPSLIARMLMGPDHVLSQMGLFFSKAAVVTFGGAYALLAYLAQAAVETYAWLQPGEMMDGLGLAETTPGPLILVTQFVAFLGAYHHAGTGNPLLIASIAALLCTWVTFVPSFLFIFLGAPHVESLHGNRRLSGALAAITAAVVGVIFNLALWFGLHVLFGELTKHAWGPLHVTLPVLDTLRPASLLLAGASAVLLLRLHWGMLPVLALAALTGALLHQLGVT